MHLLDWNNVTPESKVVIVRRYIEKNSSTRTLFIYFCSVIKVNCTKKSELSFCLWQVLVFYLCLMFFFIAIGMVTVWYYTCNSVYLCLWSRWIESRYDFPITFDFDSIFVGFESYNTFSVSESTMMCAMRMVAHAWEALHHSNSVAITHPRCISERTPFA